MARKSLKDEIGIMRRYAELTPYYFRVIKEALESDNQDDKRWAVERLDKAFVKMIPQTINGEGEDGEIIIKLTSYGGNNPPLQLPTQALPTSSSSSD